MKKRLLSLALCLTLCLGLLPPAAFAASGDGSISGGVIGGNETSGESGGVYIPPGTPTEGGGGQYQDTRTEIWCVSKPDSIGRSYDGTTDGSTVLIDLTFTDGTNTFELREGTGFTAKKTFDSADAGWHTVTVEITLIGEAAKQYKLKEDEEKFEIGGHINKAYPKPTVSLSRTTCTVGEKLLPLLSVSGVEEDAAVTYYYTQYKTIAGDSEYEGTDAVPKIDENTTISEPGTYYVYAKTAETKNYEEERSTTVELTVSENTVPAVSIPLPDGTDEEYDSLPAAMKAVQNGGYIWLNKDVTVSAEELDEGFTAENALALNGKRITLNLNGYVLESNDVPLTVKSGASLFVANADAKNTETATQVGLNLNLLVEKGGTFGCSTGKVKKLQLQNAGEGEYGLRLANGGSHCTIGFFSSEDDTITVEDALKKNHAGLALHAERSGSAIQIERSTPIDQIDSECNSFYVGACNGHELNADNVCIYCGTAVEVDTCIAHAMADDYSYIWHLKTWDDIVSEIFNKLTDTYKTITITFLTDVTTDKALSIERCNTYITLDLNGHTISGQLDTPVIETNFLYGGGTTKDNIFVRHCIAIQNGTIENTGTGAALKLSSGATTLEDVNVTGDLILTGTFVGSSNYIPTFLGGGNFTRITTSNASAHFNTLMPNGFYFAHIGSENRIPGNSLPSGESLENVTVLPCNHKDADGNYTFEKSYGSYGKMICTICGNACPHEDRTQDDRLCNACGLALTVSLYSRTNSVNGSEYCTTYYPSFSEALNVMSRGDSSVYTLLCDQPSSRLTISNRSVIDFNGFTLTKSIGGKTLDIQHSVTFKNTDSRQAHYAGKITAKGSSSPPRSSFVVPEGTNLLIDEFEVLAHGSNTDISSFAGGSFGKISAYGNQTLAGLLTNGYYYADTTTGQAVSLKNEDGSEKTTLENVTVTKCSHDEAVYDSTDHVWKCYCGQKTFVASVTKGEATTLYTDLQEAFQAADGGTVKLMASVVDVTVNTDKAFTLDLNGCEVYSLTVNNKITIKDSAETKGKITEWLRVTVDGLTVGDLLEEGYAFKYSNGTWPPETSTAVGNVSVQPAPITSVGLTALNADNTDAPTTIPYGTTGGVKLSASCNQLSTTAPECKWYKVGGTEIELSANGMNYSLPADLAVGTHKYRVTFTSDGYSKSAEITITVTPLSIKDAKVAVQNPTYNGQAQTPKVTVKLGDKTLTENKDYTVTATAQTDTGSYKLTVNGMGGYTGTIENVGWKIEPMKINSVMIFSPISKVYDGTAQVKLTAEEWAKILEFRTSFTSATVTVPSSAYTISNARFVEYRNDQWVDSPAAGQKSAIAYTITFTSSNYVLQSSKDKVPVSSEDNMQSGGEYFTITKASAPNLTSMLSLYVTNEVKKTYEVDLAEVLPALPQNCKYGNISYTVNTDGLDGEYYSSGATVEGGKLILPIEAANSKEGSIGSVTVTVITDNYQNIPITIPVAARNKLVPVLDGTVSATEITYGQPLSESKLTVTGAMKAPHTGEEIKGTFAWKDGTVKPRADSPGLDNYEAEWTFTPDAPEYATATGKVTVKVNRAQFTNVSVHQDGTLTYNGQPQSAKTITTATSVDGSKAQFSYSEVIYGSSTSTVPPYTDAGTYTVFYNAYDVARNHDTFTGSFTVTIDPKPLDNPTIELSGDFTYTGEEVTPKVTVKDGDTTIDPKEYEVSYKDNTNAGTATVIITDKPSGNYNVSGSKTFTITKAAATCTAPTANALTYNGNAQALVNAGSTQDGNMVYSLAENGKYSETVPSAVNADGYVVWYKVLGDANHNDTTTASVSVTISPATVTVKASDKSAYVGGTAPDLSQPELDKDYTVSGLFGEDTLKTAPKLSYVKTPDMSKVGEAEIKIEGAEVSSNYKLEYQNGKLTIATRPSSGSSGSTGTKTDTVKNPDGSTTKTETKSDGSKTETTTATTPGGSTGSTVTKTDAKGNSKTEASAKLSDKDVKNAQEKGEAVNVPVKDIEAGKDSNSATEIKIDVPKNSGKTTVEIPVDNVTSGTVAVIVHPDGTEEIAKSSKPTEDGVQLEINGSTTVKIIDNSKDFIDTRDHWSRDEVNFVAARELFNGVGNNLFGVSQPMTRGMVNTVLARLSGVDTTPGQGQTWYEVGTEWAKKNGISDGTNPTGNVTREQLATLLYRYAGSPDVSGSLSFADANNVSDYAKNALLWANQNGIVNGVGNNTIAPKSNAERAQVAAMFARYLKNQ